MKRIVVSTALLLAAFAAFAVNPVVAAASGQGAIQISGSCYGVLSPEVGEWVGYAIISFANKPPKFATYTCTGNPGGGGQDKEVGMFYGTETMVVTFTDGSGSFQFDTRYRATPESAAGIYLLHAFSTIGHGTGQYAGISGNSTSEGPFIGIVLPLENGAPLMSINAVHGQVTGITVE